MASRIALSCRRVVPRICPTSVNRRQLTTSATEAADQLMRNFADKTTTRSQLLDGNQLQKLSLTLSRRHLKPDLDVSEDPPPAGTPLPPGYHLAYFTPGGLETELGPDGTDLTFNSPAPFTRRMWAGGQMKWSEKCQLRVGDVAEERTRLLSAVPKKSRDGSEMVLVKVEKQFWVKQGLLGTKSLALSDQRSWIFRPELKAAVEPIATPVQGTIIRGPSVVEDEKINGRTYPQRRLRWSPVGLFRFSALTFNGHKIHYENSWTQGVENHPACVVHGPLNLINMLDYWRDINGKREVAEINYRAMSPLYAGDTYYIRTWDVTETHTGDGEQWEISVEKEGAVCMQGSIRSR
ncbi:hypothetical protein BJ170DRAFT_390673 [Xylariales sp. AK1849]|nr:hypothetical protein BJ170DRAFT_390673 [Xylariales sp. AK1849]